MLNAYPLNGETLNGQTLDYSFLQTGSGQLFAVEQSVKVIGSGLVLSAEQDVKLRITGSNAIINIEQNVVAIGSGQIVAIEQNVNVANSFLSRNGFDCDIFIGGYQVPKSQITNSIVIEKSENKSSSLSFTLLTGTGVQNPESYQGKAVIVNLTDSTGTYRAFTGYIDTPNIDLIEKKIQFDCTDRRDARILNLPASLVSFIGYYSNEVFGEPKDQSDELDKRLSTIPTCFDFDNYGNPVLTNWAPKATADYTLSGSDVYYQNPSINYVNKSKTINTINLNINYHFQRLHQQLKNFSWSGYQNFLSDWFNNGTPSFPTRDTVQSSAFGSQWRPIHDINFTALWPAGGFGSVQWQPNLVTNEYKERVVTIYLPYESSPGVYTTVWPDGKKYPVESPVLDANGKKIYDVISTTITDTSSNLCRGATWTGALQFSQNVIYEFNIVVNSPQAVDRFGVIKDVNNIDVTDQFDTSQWDAPTAAKNYYASSNFFINKWDHLSDLFSAVDVAVRKSKTAILAAHRQTQVSFRRNVWGPIDLNHTVEISSTPLSCKGKVSSIKHTIDCQSGQGYTDVSLLLSRSFGGDTEGLFELTFPNEDASYIGTSIETISLGTHLGINPDPTVTPGADKWNGYIGNKTISTNLLPNQRTQYAESFIVDSPAIPDALRSDRTIASDINFIIEVPNDDLEVDF